MKKIILLCNQGMSTSALVAKMNTAAESMGLECSIAAYAVDTAKTNAADADVIFLGPQVRYKLSFVKEIFPDKPVEVIDMAAYGMMDGAAVVKRAQKLMEG
mgnify:FL=1